MKALDRRGLWVCALFAAACSAKGPASGPAAQQSAETTGPRVAFVGVTVITMEPKAEGAAKLSEQTVIVAGGRIETIGPSSRVRVPEGAAVVDGRGKTLLPGLVDMHVHLSHEQHLPLYVARGVTTVRNMWGAPMHLDWRREVEEGRRLGPTIRTAGPIVDGKDPVHEGSFVALTPADADRAIEQQVAAGYDFVKAYAKLEPAVFERLVARAKAARLPVAGHVPREVGLLRALDAGEFTIEHTNTFYDALQADDSPVKGKTDRASRQKWVDHLDEGKLASIAERFVANHAWACPTRVVLDAWEPKETQLAKLARPEVKKYTLPSDLAIWTPDRDLPEAEQKRNARELAIADAVVRELSRRGVGIVAGTDVGNPLVVPGFALHDELAELVRIGLTPYAALRAATHDAAEVLGMSAEIGTIGAGKRADLVLVSGDPLRDIHDTARIEGVMARGRWIDAAEGAKLLAGVEAWSKGNDDPFAKRPPLGSPGASPAEVRFAATYRVYWKDTPFNTERVVLDERAGTRVLRAQAYDPHEGQWVEMSYDFGQRALVLAGDGATGRGRVTITRPEPAKLHAEGTLLSGDPVKIDIPIEPDAVVVPDHFLAAYALVPLDETRDVKVVSVALGSTVSAEPATWKIGGAKDATRIEIATGKGAPRIVTRDAAGNPNALTMQSHGAKLEWKRMP